MRQTDDLISRQAVIDICNSAIDLWHGQLGEGALVAVKEKIEGVPSEQPEIIRCKDCAWWTKQEDSTQGRCALLQIYPTGEWFCGNAGRREVTE